MPPILNPNLSTRPGHGSPGSNRAPARPRDTPGQPGAPFSTGHWAPATNTWPGPGATGHDQGIPGQGPGRVAGDDSVKHFYTSATFGDSSSCVPVDFTLLNKTPIEQPRPKEPKGPTQEKASHPHWGAGSLKSFDAIQKEAKFSCGSFLRKGEAFAYVGSIQNFEDQTDLKEILFGSNVKIMLMLLATSRLH